MPTEFGRRFRISAGAFASILTFMSVAATGMPSFVSRAQAQAPGPQQEQIDFDAALEGYGHWVQHPRLGDVWVPDGVPQEWQPYRIGHWLYTDEWGWYWNSDEPFGWVTYHYGRWYLDRQIGWVWIPNDQWGPAWVNWRQGDNFVGWAPTPPDEFVEDDEIFADTYMFVRAGDLMAPEVYTVFIPYRDRRDYYYRSTLVNRTVYFADHRGAVNPGIPPAYIASATGRPFHSSAIAPVVIAGTIGVVGAVILHDHYRDRSRTRIHVRDSDRVYRPGERFQRLPSLNKGERGRLGNNAPLAARGRTPVLQVKSDAQTKGQRQFPSRPAGMPQSNPQLQQSKQISPNSQRPPNAMQPKSIPTTPADNNRGRQFDGSRQNFDRRDFEQKKLEQRGDQKNMLPQSSQNLQRQNNQPQFPRNSGPGNMPPVQQNNAPRQNFRPPQQNYQPPNVQRPPQHNPAPHVQQQSRPQPQPSRPAPKPNQEKKN